MKRLRNVGLATGIRLGCIWPLIQLCATVVVSWGLWDALGWPAWILWIGIILLCFDFDIVFFVMLFVACVAGFFKGIWQWSLAVLALPVFGFGGNMLLGLLLRAKDEDLAQAKTPDVELPLGGEPKNEAE